MTEPIHILSLGAGVQSSTMALMAAAGEITPMPTAAIFADTRDEPQLVYEHLDRLRAELPFPIHKCSRNGSALSDLILEWGFSQIPAFMAGGKKGKRQCTKHWKVIPIQKACRSITGTTRQRLPAGYFCLWIGISVDEIGRCKDSRVPWITHRFPLVEKRMSRRDCINWLAKHNIPIPPKSACVFCPYHNREQWNQLKIAGGADWVKVKKVSAMLEPRGEFLTPDCQPIDQVDIC